MHIYKVLGSQVQLAHSPTVPVQVLELGVVFNSSPSLSEVLHWSVRFEG